MAIFTNPNYDFIKWRWHAIAFSALIIIAGFAYAFTKGVPLGIDFSGGTIIVAKFEQPVTVDQVRTALAADVPGEHVIQSYGAAANREILIRLPMAEGAEEGAALEAGANAVIATRHDAAATR